MEDFFLLWLSPERVRRDLIDEIDLCLLSGEESLLLFLMRSGYDDSWRFEACTMKKLGCIFSLAVSIGTLCLMSLQFGLWLFITGRWLAI